MSIETKAVIPTRLTPQKVCELLAEAGYDVVGIEPGRPARQLDADGQPAYRSDSIVFHDHEDLRNGSPNSRVLKVYSENNFQDHSDVTGHCGPGTLLAMRCDGNASTIVRRVVERTGGWFTENDSSNAWETLSTPVAGPTP